ncbi:hypothetical protein FGB62_146g05 [Gracilaria domingensis]|nr:hypothetical protein FGB62_146g05 [Gracilaria domingensis]
MAAPHTLPAYARQVSPGMVGICKPAFTQAVILPVAKCFCNALFNEVVSVNVQERAESDCINFFGSEEAILALEDPCVGFTTGDGSLNVPLIETLLNVIRKKCFPDDVFEVIVTEN